MRAPASPFERYMSKRILSFAYLMCPSVSAAKTLKETCLRFAIFNFGEKSLAHIYKKAIYYFPVSYFCFTMSQNCILAELRLPTVIRKVKFIDFVKRATSPKMQLAEFRFHRNSKVHSLL